MNQEADKLEGANPIRTLTRLGRRLHGAQSENEVAEIAAEGVLDLGLGHGGTCVVRGLEDDAITVVERGTVPAPAEPAPNLDAWLAVQAADPTARSVGLEVQGRSAGLLLTSGPPPEDPRMGQWLLISLGDQVSAALEQLQRDYEAVTAARRAEALEHQVEDGLTAMAALGHDVRSPLQVVRTGLRLLARPDVGPRRRREVMTRVERALDFVGDVFQDLQSSAELVGGRLELRTETCSLLELWSAAWALHPQAETLRFHLRADVDEAHHVLADPRRTKQILVNLVDNAVKYAGEGQLWIRSLDRPAGFVELHVEDEGPGIRPEQRERIFDLFRRGPSPDAPGSGKGFGLGLGVSRRLAEAMGGDLRLAPPERAQGAHFVLELPSAAARAG